MYVDYLLLKIVLQELDESISKDERNKILQQKISQLETGAQNIMQKILAYRWDQIIEHEFNHEISQTQFNL